MILYDLQLPATIVPVMGHPTAFTSYSWDDDDHRLWVAQLARRLREDGVDVKLDQWHAVPGDQLPAFMEREIRENLFVLIVCTPKYKLKSDSRMGGVGYEGDIMTAEVVADRNHRKFIPILARGTWAEAAPSWLKGKFHIDLSQPERFEAHYQDLLLTVRGQRPGAPPLGPIPRSNVANDPSVEAEPSKYFPSANRRRSGLSELWKRFTTPYDPVLEVARRFLKIFEDHGVAVAQIPEFLPEIPLDKLQTPDRLLPVLTPSILKQTAALFNVRLNWLRGVDSQIYDRLFCYKTPKKFFEALAQIRKDFYAFPIRILYSARELDGSTNYSQPLALLLLEKICDFGEREIYRYRIFGDGWDWCHAPCRVQLKAIARVVNQVSHHPVSMYRVKQSELEAVRNGQLVPTDFLKGSPITEPSLEDFALSARESSVAKECEELPLVLEYIKAEGLDALARSAHSSNNETENAD